MVGSDLIASMRCPTDVFADTPADSPAGIEVDAAPFSTTDGFPSLVGRLPAPRIVP